MLNKIKASLNKYWQKFLVVTKPFRDKAIEHLKKSLTKAFKKKKSSNNGTGSNILTYLKVIGLISIVILLTWMCTRNYSDISLGSLFNKWTLLAGIIILIIILLAQPKIRSSLSGTSKYVVNVVVSIFAVTFLLFIVSKVIAFTDERMLTIAKKDNDMRMDLAIQTGTTQSVEASMIPYGPFTSDYNLEEGTRVTWGSLSGSFYPIEIGKTIMVELTSCTDPSKHCQIRVQRTSAGRAKVNFHLDTARESDGTYKDGLYTIKWISDKQAFVYSPAPIVLDENNEMYIAHN